MGSRNVFLAHKNYLKSTFNHVVISGGNFANLNNLKNPDLTKVAVSNGAALANTLIHIDLGALVDVRVFAIPDNIKTFKPSRTAKHRIRASQEPKWQGLELQGASNDIGNTSITVQNSTAAPVTVASGDTFSIAHMLPSGQPVKDVYKVGLSVTVAANSTGTISLAPALKQNYNDGDVLICNIGNFTTTQYDSGWNELVEATMPLGSVPWGHPSLWDGKPTDEELQTLPYPVVKIFDLVLARYWLYEFDDVGNRAWNEPNITIPYLFIGNGYQPSVNATYGGTNIGFLTETSVQTTIGGRRIYGKEPIARRAVLSIPNIEENEAFGEAFDLQWVGGISEELFFIFNPEDTVLMNKRGFLANLEKLNPLEFPYFNTNNLNYELVEVL